MKYYRVPMWVQMKMGDAHFGESEKLVGGLLREGKGEDEAKPAVTLEKGIGKVESGRKGPFLLFFHRWSRHQNFFQLSGLFG